MSTYPSLEARVSALERRQINTDARIEEVTGEMTNSVKQISNDIANSFKQMSDYQGKTENLIEARFDKIEAIMATKEDITRIETSMVAMEARILDAFRQLLTTINPQRPPKE